MFLNNDVFLLEKPYSGPKFIRFVVDKKGFHIEKSIDGLLTNYKFSYQSTCYTTSINNSKRNLVS